LLEDLQTALEQLSRGESIKLPAKTTSIKYWAERLVEYARSSAVRDELEYWLTSLPARIPAIPLDYPNGMEANTEASTRAVKVSLSVEETRALLQEVPKAYNTQINDVLLTALVQTFFNWTGTPSVLIDLEGHGREDIFEDVDLSRTVGWFTVFYPILLCLEERADPGEALISIKEQLRRIPNRGIGFGLLRYLSEEVPIVAQMRQLPHAQVNFNYLGQFDQVLRESSRFGLVQEPNIRDRSPRGTRSHLLEIVGSVIRGRLQVEWSYSQNLHQHTTIADLAQGLMEALRSLISHCQSAETRRFTPSDFAEFNWDRTDVENIAAAILKSQGEI
jgi:non-ribosomal peptide synthase protein (TIGR01720 family)